MRTVSHSYINYKLFKSFLQTEHIQDGTHLLVQVFTSATQRSTIETLLESIKKALPSAHIIGTTTDGEIFHGQFVRNSHIITITEFEHTKVRTVAIDTDDTNKSDETIGKKLALSLWSHRAKLIIAFGEGLHTDGDALLKGAFTVAPDIKIVGGLAGDYTHFQQTYVFNENTIVTKGIVGAVLEGEALHVHLEYSMDWFPIGKPMRITKAKGNRIHKIDNYSAYDAYAHYLGTNIAKKLPALGIDFPLITKRDDHLIARAIIGSHDDGSLSLAGSLEEGEIVTFGYGNPESIITKAKQHHISIGNKPVESIFTYSCSARKRLMRNLIEQETLPLQDLAETNGFFTYGEFFTDTSPQLFNQTIIFVTLSESDTVHKKAITLPQTPKTASFGIEALSHLLHVTTLEIEEQNHKLNQFAKEIEAQKESIKLIQEIGKFGSWVLDFKQHKVTWSDQLYKIYGFNKDFIPDEHTFLSLVVPEYRQKVYDALLCAYEGKHIELHTKVKNNNGQIIDVWVNGRMIFDDSGQPHKLIGTTLDVTEIMDLHKKLEEKTKQLNFLAHHDLLTNIPNRIYFESYLQKAIQEAKKYDELFALLFIDLDNFKHINDTLGHHVGDLLLKEVATQLQFTIRKNDFLSRIGGDEFTIVLRSLHSKDDIKKILSKILSILSHPIVIDDYELNVSASIGISIYPVDSHTYDDLLKFSDIAMYEAKSKGKNRYCFFDDAMIKQS